MRHLAAVAVAAAIAVPAVLVGCGGGDDAAAVAFPDSLVDGERVATVNDHPITGRGLRVFTLVYQPESADSLHSRLFNLELLNGYVDRIILWQEAVAGGVTVTDSTHAWFVNRFLEAFGGAQRIDALLSRFGISRAELESVIRRDLVVRRFIEERLAPGIEVTDADARAFYDNNPEQFASRKTVRARHIIIRTEPTDSDSVLAGKRTRAEALRDRARAGEDFEKLAAEHSEGPSAAQGGDLGYFSREEMVEPFANAAFALDSGEISDVVKTGFGFHVIKVEDHRETEQTSYDEVRDQLLDGLYDRELGAVVENHLKRMRSVAIIEPNFDYGGLTQRESTTFTR